MTTQKNNNNATSGIEKFEGTFEKEESGVTIVVNKSINEIRNSEALGLYIYLLARPPGWKLNVNHLKEHFQCNKDKIYLLLNYLMKEGFITKSSIREHGKFVNHHYRIHLHQVQKNTVTTQAGIGFSPLLEKPDLVTPELVNPDAYKTKILINKEYKKEKINKKEKSQSAEAHISKSNFSKKQNKPAYKSDFEKQAMNIMLSNNPFEIEVNMLADWVAVRKQKRAFITNTAWKRVLNELEKCKQNGLDPKDCFAQVVSAGWQSFKMEWFVNQEKPRNGYSTAKDKINYLLLGL